MLSIVNQRKFYEEKYLLRWRFEYKDHAPRYGAWSSQGTTKELYAWCQPKENLSVAIIEGKDVKSRLIKPLLVCEGHNFVNFEWVAFASIAMQGSQKVTGSIQGLTIVSRDMRATIFIDGSSEIRRRTNDEIEKIKYAAYRR